MKNRLRILLTLSTLILAITACVFPRLTPRETPVPDDTSFVGVGDTLSAFTEIDIEAAGPIFLVQGDKHAILIEGPKNIVDGITYEVRNGVLLVKHSRDMLDWITDRDYPTITITFENLTRFVLEGGTELVAKDLRTDSLSVMLQGGASLDFTNMNVKALDMVIEGGSEIDISGIAETQTLKFAGGTNYDAEDLKSVSVSLKIEGAVSATVWATETLDLDVSGVYNVRYYGNPSVTQKIQGVGNIEGMGEK
ncbi:MAG: head GIN domain-containing protein [Anaerolineaceae bacterium]|jgi:hypothetical protein|nr:head GIN domain-containing protein [Anaerolineaceae bacterium]